MFESFKAKVSIKKLYTISRLIEISSREFETVELVVQASSAYNVYNQFKKVAGLPEAIDIDDIGEHDNPCIRFIVNRPDKDRLLLYVKPFKPSKDDA